MFVPRRHRASGQWKLNWKNSYVGKTARVVLSAADWGGSKRLKRGLYEIRRSVVSEGA